MHIAKASDNDTGNTRVNWLFYELRRDAASASYEYRRMRSKPSASVFGRRLREARLQVGIPQDKLGVMVGIDESTASARISRYETGTHGPQFEIAVALAKALRVPIAYLYCDDDELASLILAWGRLPRAGRKRLRAAIERGDIGAGNA